MKPPIRIELPIPPSVNNLFFNAGGKRIISANYLCWKSDAGWRVRQQKPAEFIVPVALTLTILGGKGFPINRDLDNCWKAVQDLLKELCVIPGDSVVWVRELHSYYLPPADKKQAARCWVEITEADPLTEGDTH